MIGLSLSFCLADIAKGKVHRSDVERLIVGTPTTKEELFSGYMASYWRQFPEETMRELFEWAISFMEQPRVTNDPVPCIGSGHWVTTEEDIQYENL